MKTYDYLHVAMKEIIEDSRREKVREDDFRGHAGNGGRGRQPPPSTVLV